MRKLGILAALGLAAAVLIVFAAGPAASGNGGPSTTVVMTGLDNPRGLAWGPGGWLYVAEAGAGGSGPCLVIRGENQCVGATGAVSRWKPGRTPQRVATGLPSYAPRTQPAMDGATGPHDIEFKGSKAWLTIGLGGDPAALRPVFGNGFGKLVRLRRNGSWSFSTDIAALELSNPGGGPVDSNPYGLLLRGDTKYVAEAGANTLVRVEDGSASTAAIIPSRAQGRGTDSVPTEVIKGPGKSLLVSDFTGGPFLPGQATIWRVERNGTVTPYLTGFKAIIDMAWSCDRQHLYVLQFSASPGPGLAPPGALLKVNPRTNERTQIAGPELLTPTSVLPDCRGHDGDGDDDDDDDGGRSKKSNGREVLYVSNKGMFPDIGEVLRLVR